MTPHVRLAIIARNEAARLPDLAEQTLPLIDSVCVCIDDRTTDDTESVAEDAFASVPGSIVSFPFQNFGQARNFCLAEARKGLDPDDYLLLLDPDSPLRGGFDPDALTLDAYQCHWRWAGEEWPRTVLVRVGAPAVWEGRVHEVLAVNGTHGFLETLHVDARVSAGPERLAWIEGELRKDAATSPRSAFYLAQTLNDQGRTDEAFGWYMRRAAMGEGWGEETWLATLKAAEVIVRLDWKIAEELYRRCILMDGVPARAEPHYFLAKLANDRGEWHLGLAHAAAGLRVGRSTATLRVNRWVEVDGLSQEFNRAAFAIAPQPDPAAILPTISREELLHRG